MRKIVPFLVFVPPAQCTVSTFKRTHKRPRRLFDVKVLDRHLGERASEILCEIEGLGKFVQTDEKALDNVKSHLLARLTTAL